MTLRPKLLEAQTIAQRIPAVLQRRGVRPVFSAWLLTEDRDLMLRGDLAFGQDSVEGYLSFGHAF